MLPSTETKSPIVSESSETEKSNRYPSSGLNSIDVSVSLTSIDSETAFQVVFTRTATDAPASNNPSPALTVASPEAVPAMPSVVTTNMPWPLLIPLSPIPTSNC